MAPKLVYAGKKFRRWSCRLTSGHMVITRTIKPRGTTETYFSSALSRVRFVHAVFETEYSCGAHLGICTLIESGVVSLSLLPRLIPYHAACLYVWVCVGPTKVEQGMLNAFHKISLKLIGFMLKHQWFDLDNFCPSIKPFYVLYRCAFPWRLAWLWTSIGFSQSSSARESEE